MTTKMAEQGGGRVVTTLAEIRQRLHPAPRDGYCVGGVKIAGHEKCPECRATAASPCNKHYGQLAQDVDWLVQRVERLEVALDITLLCDKVKRRFHLTPDDKAEINSELTNALVNVGSILQDLNEAFERWQAIEMGDTAAGRLADRTNYQGKVL